jgi:hypothetical protein
MAGQPKKRHNIVLNGVCGESKDVNESVVSEYKPKLLEFISPYEPKTFTMRTKQDCFFGCYQQNHSQLMKKSELNWTPWSESASELYRPKCTKGKNVERKTYSVIVWEYGGRNGKASKTKMFQEPEN